MIFRMFQFRLRNLCSNFFFLPWAMVKKLSFHQPGIESIGPGIARMKYFHHPLNNTHHHFARLKTRSFTDAVIAAVLRLRRCTISWWRFDAPAARPWAVPVWPPGTPAAIHHLRTGVLLPAFTPVAPLDWERNHTKMT